MTMPARTHVTKIALPGRDLLGIGDLEREDITAILDLADYYVAQNRRRSQSPGLLKGMILVNLFLEDSTRTRLSFEMAAKRLGGGVINMGREGSSLKKGESLSDTLKTINAMLPDILVIRHGAEGAAHEAARLMDCPVVNGGDGAREHPTQGLLDALTLRRRFGGLDGLTVAICGDSLHCRAAHSNILLLEKMGVRVKCVGPQGLLAAATESTADMEEGLKDADAVMVLRLQKERMKAVFPMTDAEYFRDYGLTLDRLRHARPGAVVMHPGAMNRGVEIDAALADDPERSLITAQVEMGVAVRMACLDLLTRRSRR